MAPSGLLTAHTLAGYFDSTVDGYRRVAAAVQPHGTKLFVQLFHGGREVISSAPRRGGRLGERAAEPALPDRAARAAHRRGRGAGRLLRALRRDRRRGGARRDRGDRRPRLPAGAVLRPGAERSRRPLSAIRRAFVTEVLGAVRAAAPGLALGVRLSADSPAARAIAPRSRRWSTTSTSRSATRRPSTAAPASPRRRRPRATRSPS